MHDGCSAIFDNGKQVVNKVRMMGFSEQFMVVPLEIQCVECNTIFKMEKYEGKCPHCRMVYGVTPCHAFDPANVRAAGIDF